MEEATKHLAIYLAGLLGIYKGIPVGIAVGASPFHSALFTALGSISSVLLLYLAGDKFRFWLLNKYGHKSIEHKKARFTKWMDKYGIAGLGLMVTGLLGPFISLLLGMMFLSQTKKFLVYLLIGVIMWSFAVAYLTAPAVEMAKHYF